MQRARRLASIAVIACLTVGGLSACRADPEVAIYLGADGRVSVAEVQRIYDDARAKLEAAQAAAAASGQQAGASAAALEPVEMPISAPDIVNAMVSRDIVTRIAKANNVTLPTPLPLQEVAQTLQLPPDAEYVKLYAESRLLFSQLIEKAPATTPADADIKHVFDVFEATGQMKPGLTYAEFRQSVSEQALQTLGKAVNVKQQVEAQLDQLDLTVNPRYESSEIAVYTETGPDNKALALVSVPLTDEDSSPVIDPA